MKRNTKRIIAMLVAMIIIISILPLNVMAATGKPTFSVKDTWGAPGGKVDVQIDLKGNPGILGAAFVVSYDSALQLTAVSPGDAFSALSMTKPGKLASPCKFVWDGQDISDSDVKDGTVLVLTFTINSDAELNKDYAVMLSAGSKDIYDRNLNPVAVNTVNGSVMAINYIPGDVNTDTKVSVGDVVALRRHIAGGYEVKANEAAADVDDNNNVSVNDIILIRRYIAGGYGVELLPHHVACTHSLKKVSAKEPTAEKEGNIAYWKCSVCGKLFSDQAGTTKIKKEDTVIPPIGNGKARITYKLVNTSKDPYLAKQTIKNNNPSTYVIGEGLKLSNDLAVDGYTFVGWFDSFDDSATQIKEIPATANKDITLYAHWKENVYTITYNLYQTPVTSAPTDEQKRYTVSEGNSNLYNPEINNYIFLGWYDENGVEYKTIPAGTTGPITLNAYYTSLRNLAVSTTDNNPIIVEDRDNNIVYFTYELGEIRHIPLVTEEYGTSFWEIQSVAGLKQQVSNTYTTTIAESSAESISKTVSDMTVNSNTWTLSESWNDVTTVNETWAESIGKTTEQCKSEATTSSNTLSISDQMGGSAYHRNEDGSTTYDYNSKTETKDKGHQFDVSLSGKYSNKMSANFGESNEYGTEDSFQKSNAYTREGQINAENWSLSGSDSGSQASSSSVSDKDKYSAGIGFENGYEINGGLKYGYHDTTNTVTKTGSDKVSVTSNIDENTSSWNSSASFSATNTRSTSQSIRNTLSDIVTTTKGYGKSYSNGGTDSTTQGFTSTASNTSGTTSTVTFSKIKAQTTTTTYEVDGKIEGKYRCILVGTAHVFGVVGYDYNTKSYFTYTFSVMDDKTDTFLDYTPKGGNFTDCENSCLPFEIPIDVFEYVNERTSKTTGLQYTTNSSKGTARITGYKGTSADVIIPSYVSDGKQAYKVTEIAATAFAGKGVRAVVLGEFIESIPAGAFKNCTKLEAVIGSFTEIGDEAFDGCVKLSEMNIPSNVVKIGENAFRGADSINVRAINSLCSYAEAVKALPNGTDDAIYTKQKEITQGFIDSALNSGARNIAIDISNIVRDVELTLAVPAIDSIEIDGGSEKYSNFSLKSDAASTVLKEIEIENSSAVPLTIGSDKLILRKTFITGNTTALILKKDGAVLSLRQDSDISSGSQYTVIGKNPVIEAEVSGAGAVGFLNIVGNFGYVNSIQGEENINITNGSLKEITDTEYENYVKGAFTVTFDVNNGKALSESEASKTVYLGNKYGALPAPTRDYYTFSGWYTAKTGGTRVTKDTEVTEASNITLYAHWKQNTLSDWTPASQVPSGAKIEEEKWSYTLRTTKTSSESSLSGWTQYDKQRTSWGPTQGPVNSDPSTSNDSRNVWSEQYISGYGTKQIYVFYWWAESYNSNPARARIDGYPNKYTMEIGYYPSSTSERPIAYYNGTIFYRWEGNNWYYCWFDHEYSETDYNKPQYGTRWYYQEPVYTYYYYQNVSKEATSDPTGQTGVSNVQHLVRYRVK